MDLATGLPPYKLWTFAGEHGKVVMYLFSPEIVRAAATPATVMDYLLGENNSVQIWERLTPRSRLLHTSIFPTGITPFTDAMKIGRAVVGYTEDMGLLIVFAHEKRQNPGEVLADIGRRNATFPPDLAVMLYTAVQSRAQEYIQAPIIAQIVYRTVLRTMPPSLHPYDLWRRERLTDSAINDLARRYVDQLPITIQGNEGNVELPLHPVDTARWMLRLSAALWKPRVLRAIADIDIPTEGESAALLSGFLAALHPILVPHLEITVGNNARIKVQGKGFAVAHAWPQAVEFERGGIDQKTYQALTGGAFPDGWQTVDVPLPPTKAVFVPPHMKKATIQSLLTEAEQGPFLPHGAFTLFLPRDFPLRAWGVSALRVVAIPNPPHLWVGVQDREGRVSVCFRWDPGQPIARWVVANDAAQILDLTLAALWHDLRVARERAFPGRRRGGRGGEEKASPRLRRESRERAVQYLPRTVYRIRGKRDWGGEAEARAARRAHAVRAHLRRLPEGWQASEEAKILATSFGYVLPAGYTFVRPHVRGGQGEEREKAAAEEREPVVVARGLVTVMAVVESISGAKGS